MLDRTYSGMYRQRVSIVHCPRSYPISQVQTVQYYKQANHIILGVKEIGRSNNHIFFGKLQTNPLFERQMALSINLIQCTLTVISIAKLDKFPCTILYFYPDFVHLQNFLITTKLPLAEYHCCKISNIQIRKARNSVILSVDAGWDICKVSQLGHFLMNTRWCDWCQKGYWNAITTIRLA